MENTLKTLFVKQKLDLLGPRTSFEYSEGVELDLLKLFKGKASLYELIVYFKADYAIVDITLNSPWLNSLKAQPGYIETMTNTTTNVVPHNQIDYGKYDLVITHDPILGAWINTYKKTYPKTLFAYILAEHSSWQMHEFGFDYDLYLDHTCQSGEKIVRLPQSINMLFPRVPDKLRELFNNSKTHIFLDYRSIGHFISGGNNNVALEMSQVDSFFEENKFTLPTIKLSKTSLKPFMFGGDDDDGVKYYEKLSCSKYFVSIANRVGQAAFDAASVGSLVIGTDKSALHRMICHPDALLSGDISIIDLQNKIEYFENNQSNYENALNYQENSLNYNCTKKPINDLNEAWKIKTS